MQDDQDSESDNSESFEPKDPLSRNKKLSSAMVAKLFVHQLARVASYKIHIDPPCTIAR